ncbi:MAG: NAD(P)/FAD-dependent oxidoreductase [Limisphaerales bacterium]
MKNIDAIVIGGGPAGSCAATWLARRGRSVVLLEREHFPRFHIGESLLPYNSEIFDELGVTPRLREAGFPVKAGAQFHLGNQTKQTAFVFREGRFTRHHAAFQVERSRFDEILLRHGAECGVEVREGVTVERVTTDLDGVTVSTASGEALRARFVIDASGRSNLTGTQEGLKVPNPKLRKLAVFAHFDGVQLDPGSKGGDTVIVREERHWFWLIPIRIDGDGRGRVSVGAVLDRETFSEMEGSAAEILKRLIDCSPAVKSRMGTAVVASEVRVTSDFSYRNRRLSSQRCIRVGDAAGFIDPIFSSGVFIAMHSARAAAAAVEEGLTGDHDASGAFERYEHRLAAAMRVYQEMVEGFYTKPFMELFLEPRAKLGIAAAVNAVLAGELAGGWRLLWRMRVFFWLVRLQARFPLVPRFSFGTAG